MNATQLLKDRFSDLGFDPSKILASGLFMHTINHPKISAVHDVARQALVKAGLSPETDVLPPPDPLKNNSLWPVYKDLPMGESYTFYCPRLPGPKTMAERAMDLPTFIARSYEAYAGFGHELPAVGPVDRARDFIRTYVVRKAA